MSLINTLTSLAPAILSELESLILKIVSSKDPSAEIAKAKRGLEIDAMNAATDAALNEALKKLHKK